MRQLHRVASELTVSLADLVAAMVAWQIVEDRQTQELERMRR